MPCQKKMDESPAMLKISEKARKYHFLPRKSMLVLRNNSTASPLNAQRFATLMAVENGFENYSGNENRSEQVGGQTEAERHRKTLHRTGSEQKQDDGRDDRRNVRVEDGRPGVSKSLIYCRRRRLAVSQFFTDTLEDQHVGIDAHTDREDHSGNSRQRERRPAEAEEAKQDHQVQKQSEIGVNSGEAVVEEHEDHDCQHANHCRAYALTNRVGAERRTHRHFLQVLDTRRQRA